MSFTQNRDEADTSVLGYTHQVYLKTQQLWCNSSRYQSNKSPGPILGNLEESIQSRVETFSTKKHPKGKRFYSRSIRQLKGTQVVFFHGHRRGWTSHCDSSVALQLQCLCLNQHNILKHSKAPCDKYSQENLHSKYTWGTIHINKQHEDLNKY